MTERVSSADVSFFYLEERSTPQHVGGVAVFEAPLDYERLVRLLEERISLVPRYRQKLRTVPGNLANPVWVDDPEFDISYHVRRSAVPRPGGDAELLEFCARIQSRLLDRDHPLWEMYFVEGLTGGRVAVVTKTHHSMVDGVGAVDIAQVLLDPTPEPRRTVGAVWMPEPEPTSTALVAEALTGMVRRPAALVETVRLGVRDARSTTAWLTGLVGGTVSAVTSLVRRRETSPLRARVGQQRRIAVARTQLADYRQVRRAHGGTVNDVVLAAVSGALRGWLLSRGELLRPSQTVRALVPVSVGDADTDTDRRVSALLVDLPIGEADPLRRLAQVRYAMGAHTASGRSVSADALVALSGFAPPTLHALGARAAHGLTRRMFSLVVTNSPGPQLPLYAAGARMTEMFPILPLGRGAAVAVGLTSYDGGVYFGVNADRDAVPDVGAIASMIAESLRELVAVSPSQDRAGAGRTARQRPTVPTMPIEGKP